MKLPPDPNQWGIAVLQNLTATIPSLQPYCQLADLLDEPTPDGGGFGIVPLTNGAGFIPFVINQFDLKPLDILVTYDSGEARFSNLSEANAILAIGGIGMGDPVNQLPVGMSPDQPFNMMPPNQNMLGMGNRNNGRPDVYGSTNSVKFSHVKPAVVSEFLGLAKAAGHDMAMAFGERWMDALETLIVKEAASQLMALERVGDRVEVTLDHEKQADLALPEATEALRQLGHAEKVATLLAGDVVIVDQRPEEKQASAFSAVHTGVREVVTPGDPQNMTGEVKSPGWYKLMSGTKSRVFLVNYFDGKPSTYKLAVTQDGYAFERTMAGVQCAAPNSLALREFFSPSTMRVGEWGFLLNEKTGEASIPFMILGAQRAGVGGKNLVVRVKPVLGDHAEVSFSFGNNQHVYTLAPDHFAIPDKGYMVVHLHPRVLNTGMMMPPSKTRVRIYKGGGVYSIKEDQHVPFTGLNRGQLASTLITRYGFAPDHALRHVRLVDTHADEPFHIMPHEESVLPSLPLNHEAAHMGIHVMKFACALEKAAWGGTDINQDPNRSGPNREQAPPGASGTGPDESAGVPMGQPGVQGPMASVPNADIPNMKEVSDLISSYAMGNFAPDELSQIFNDLIDQLADVQNLVGRVLLLVRLGKIDFVTEAEAKRLLEESDKFRASLLNADMLLKGVAMTV